MMEFLHVSGRIPLEKSILVIWDKRRFVSISVASCRIFGLYVCIHVHTGRRPVRIDVMQCESSDLPKNGNEGVPLAGGIIGAGGEITWPRPTRPGDVLRVMSEIEQVSPSRSRADRGTVRVR